MVNFDYVSDDALADESDRIVDELEQDKIRCDCENGDNTLGVAVGELEEWSERVEQQRRGWR